MARAQWYLMDCICCLCRSSSLMYALGVRFLGVEGFVAGFLGVDGADAFFFCNACNSSTFWTPFNGAVVSSLQTSLDKGFLVLILERPLGTRPPPAVAAAAAAAGLLGLENSKSNPFAAVPLEAMLLLEVEETCYYYCTCASSSTRSSFA
jgi:hypothetical protein